MVENTLEQKKRTPLWKNTLLQIIAGAIVMLAASTYLQFSGVKNYFGTAIQLPDIGSELEDPLSLIQSPTAQPGNSYSHFTTPDGFMGLDYPAAYVSGQETISRAAGEGTQTDNSLLVAYKTTFTDIKPITLTVTSYDATSTQDVIGKIEQAFKQQQCQFDIKKSDAKNETDPYELFDSNYKCGEQGDLSYWKARTAIIQNEKIFYAVTVATIGKNWEDAQLEIGSIFDSISINNPAANQTPEEPGAADGNNPPQNNETEN